MRAGSLFLDVNKASFFLSVFLFRAMLDFSYIHYVSELFSYDGFSYDFSLINYILSWFLYCLSLIMVSDRVVRVSHFFFGAAALSVVAPLTSMYGLDSDRSVMPVIITIAALFWVYLLTRLVFISFKRLPLVKNGRSMAVCASLAFVVFLMVWFLMSGAKPNLDIAKVYEFRRSNADAAATGILAYTNNWTYQIFTVYLMCMALYVRRYLVFLVLVGVQVYFFSYASHKSILFFPVLVAAVWFYFKRSNSLLMMPLALNGLLLVAMLVNYLFDDVWAISMLARRVLFVPAHLCFAYFSYFSEHSNIYWSNSVLSSIFIYPYGDVGLPYVIGEFLGKAGMAANNGFISSGYAHAGIFGVFLYATILGVALRLLNDISYGCMPVWLAVAISIVPLRSLLISSDLFTVMLTHGFLVAIILMYLSRKRIANRSIGDSQN